MSAIPHELVFQDLPMLVASLCRPICPCVGGACQSFHLLRNLLLACPQRRHRIINPKLPVETPAHVGPQASEVLHGKEQQIHEAGAPILLEHLFQILVEVAVGAHVESAAILVRIILLMHHIYQSSSPFVWSFFVRHDRESCLVQEWLRKAQVGRELCAAICRFVRNNASLTVHEATDDFVTVQHQVEDARRFEHQCPHPEIHGHQHTSNRREDARSMDHQPKHWRSERCHGEPWRCVSENLSKAPPHE
mmetsp:Transcript_158000/g.294749  ORF Transcript_158000/g.294749 Transcript_158000/m.294749 type:complete len:249 (+) Transcript_158000:516-1262(+)